MRRRELLAAGLAAALLYIGGALLSGHLSPLARRPLLEGITPPPPYRWVKPPPDLAADNKKPDTAKRALAFDARGNVAGVFNTADLQISVILEGGALPQRGGAKAGTLTLEPLDPGTFAPPPKGYEVAGNAYLVTALEGSESITTLTSDNQIQMVYPAPAPALLGREHTILRSDDGKAWTEMANTSDQPAGQQVLSTSLRTLGYFEVAVKPGTPAKKKSGGSGIIVIAIVIALAGGVAGLLIWSRGRHERQRRREEALRRARKMGSKKKGR